MQITYSYITYRLLHHQIPVFTSYVILKQQAITFKTLSKKINTILKQGGFQFC